MSVERKGSGWRVRWRDADGRNRSRTIGSYKDACDYDAELRRSRRLGTLEMLDAGTETLGVYVEQVWWPTYGPQLAAATRRYYAGLYDRHIDSHLGGLALRELSPEAIARWQSTLLRKGTPVETVRKANTLLGGMLQRAVEARRLSSNPQRLVKKPKPEIKAEVRPYAPETVERLRHAMLTMGDYRRSEFIRHRDAVLVSLLAYSGVRPEEARLLTWGAVAERTLLVTSPKTRGARRPRRSVRLLAPLRQDLLEWRMLLGRPSDADPVIPDLDGGPWTADAYANWRDRAWRDALAACGLPWQVPYTLRHSFASLLLHEGRSVIYVARQLGHDAALTLGTYGHVIEELEEAPQLAAEEAIRLARAASCTPLVPRTGESGA